MNLAYVKRFRMEIELTGRIFKPTPVADHFQFLCWEESLLNGFAEAKYLSFRNEIDKDVFPCLGELEGCRRLMSDIVRNPGFLPGATWLVVRGRNRQSGGPVYCGTVQGVRDKQGFGAIQNLGVVPEYRRAGLGLNLMLRALDGFQQAGIRRAHLEVTAQNEAAIRLYKKLGFVEVRTVYKTIESEYCK